jgi:hypothetical protein
VPPKMVSTPFGLFESDTWFGDVAGEDGVPEVVMGRLPVMTAAELDGQVKKIAGYEAAAPGPGTDWMSRIILAADDPDDAGEFPADSDELGTLIPGGYAKERIYLSETNLPEARAALLAGLNRGALLLNYIGHGLPDRYADEGLFVLADVAGLSNGDRLPIVLALTCVAGRYGIPGFDCLSEAWLMKEGGGAVAVWSPTGLSMNHLAKILNQAFVISRFTDGERVLGEAIRSAMEDYATRGGEMYILHILNLVGDPGLQVK